MKDSDIKLINSNNGFSLVELIIVIAIMVILSVTIAPAVIRYIAKSRKAVDISNGDAIGTAVNAAFTDDELLYDYLLKSSKECNSINHKYRILGYSSVDRSNNGQRYSIAFSTPNLAANYTSQETKDAFRKLMTDEVGIEKVRLHFGSFSHLDQWVICCDANRNLYVFLTSGLNGYQYFIRNDRKLDTNGNNGKRDYCYMIWPEVDPVYNTLTNPNDAN